jgi:tetratricopeptide (TPR) repeat protein
LIRFSRLGSSPDGTVAEAERFARERGESDKLIVGRFEANPALIAIQARYSAANVRPLSAAEAAVAVPHNVTSGWLVRMFRPPRKWAQPTWETPLLDTPKLPANAKAETEMTSDTWWWHHKTRKRGRRDVKILERWLEQDPENWYALQALAREACVLEDLEVAISAQERAAASPDITPDVRADLLANASLYATGLRDMAKAALLARQALLCRSSTGLAWIILAKCAASKNDWQTVRRMIARAMECRELQISKAPLMEAGFLLLLADLNLVVLMLHMRGRVNCSSSPDWT